VPVKSHIDLYQKIKLTVIKRVRLVIVQAIFRQCPNAILVQPGETRHGPGKPGFPSGPGYRVLISPKSDARHRTRHRLAGTAGTFGGYLRVPATFFFFLAKMPSRLLPAWRAATIATCSAAAVALVLHACSASSYSSCSPNK
jgi:hypothetical protein